MDFSVIAAESVVGRTQITQLWVTPLVRKCSSSTSRLRIRENLKHLALSPY